MHASVRYPLQPRPRIAHFQASDQFDPGDAGTAAFPASMLPRVWDSVWTPLYPVVVFTGPGYGVLTEEDREQIWRRWGVPVYEQMMDSDGRVVAEECDAHDGLHLVAGAAWAGAAEHGECACGLEGPKVTPAVFST
jgi:hypothetical protein